MIQKKVTKYQEDEDIGGFVQLEIWTLHGAEDDLYTQYDDLVFEEGSGPQPIDDTHPNCNCTREPFNP